MSIKVMSAHLGRGKGQMKDVAAAASREHIDVLCLQEVLESELQWVRLNHKFVRYVPMTRVPGNTLGLATCTNLCVTDVIESYYSGGATTLPEFDESNERRVNTTKNRPVLSIYATDMQSEYMIANTHYFYSAGGEPNSDQFDGVLPLLDCISCTQGCVLCAALVAPRGGEIYEELTSALHDCVPDSITCTLDPVLHKLAPKLKSGHVPPVVVDFVFNSTKAYRVSNVRQLFGVCDHTPLVFEVE